MDKRFLLDPDYSAENARVLLKFSTLNPLDKRLLKPIVTGIVLFTPFLIMMTWGWLYMIWFNVALALEGQQVEVTIVDCVMMPFGASDYTPHVTYAYQIGPTTYERVDTIRYTFSDCASFLAQPYVIARYLPESPQLSRLINAAPLWDTVSMILALGAGDIVFLWMTLSAIYNLYKYNKDQSRYRRLKERGILLEGELLTVKGKKDFKDTRYDIYVSYRFQTPDGRTLTRKQKRTRDDLRRAELPAVGTPISVLYADDDAVVML